MPRIYFGSDSRFLALLIGAAALIGCAVLSLFGLRAVENWWTTPVQTSICEPVQTGPKMEQALMSLSDAWREENRNRR